jgi:hypothetical protein
MRLFSWLGLLLLTTGCFTEYGAARFGEAGLGMDERLDQADAKDFCDQWSALMARDTPEAALQRAEMAAQAQREIVMEATCISWDQLQAQGIQDARRAVEQLPNEPRSWLVLAAWMRRTGAEPAQIAQATCKGAELRKNDPDDWTLCGDWRREADDAGGAVQAWSNAFNLSATRGERCALVERIRQTSPDPKAALAALPQPAVQDCEQARVQREERKQREERLQREEPHEYHDRLFQGR